MLLILIMGVISLLYALYEYINIKESFNIKKTFGLRIVFIFGFRLELFKNGIASFTTH